MKKRQRVVSLVAVVCLLASMLACVPASAASGYKNVYGKTLDKIRVRTSASMSGDIVDNIVRGACIYVLETSYLSGGQTFVRAKYRDVNGDVATGWVCQHDGSKEYVRILSTDDAKRDFNVKDGNLPSTRVGTKQRGEVSSANEGSASGTSEYLKLNSKGAAVTKLQTKLKAMGLYSGEITGNYGELTEKAVKAYQRKYGLYVDGIAGPSTQAKIFATATDSTTSGSSANDSVLKLDASGPRVKTLQQDLKTLGFYTAEVSGHFGQKTQDAVKAFQRKYGLTADGVAGTKTLEKMQAALGSAPSSGSSGNDTILRLNASGTRVSTLQQNLKALGLYTGEITGHFGDKTQTAVKAFQKKYNLTQDGIAGADTLAKISEVLGSSGTTSTGVQVNATLKLNSEGAAVRNLQINLAALGYYSAEVTGHYGEKTQDAVKEFQSRNGLTADGVAGPNTLTKITALIKNNTGTGSSSTTLKYGSEGDLVKKVQQKLLDLKLYTGGVTGHYGYKTVNAVKAFQTQNKLKADGITGKETLIALGLSGGGSSGSSGSNGSTVTLTSSYGVTEKDKVILRAYYTTSSKEKTRLAKGTHFKILSTHTSAGYTWLRVDVSNTTGYIRSDMARVLTAAEAQAYLNNGGSAGGNLDDEVIGMIVVTGSTVNLRASAGTQGNYVGKAKKDSVYSYTTTQSVDNVLWYKLTTGVWISGAYSRKMTDAEVENYVGKQDNEGYYTLKYDMDDDNLIGNPIQMLQTILKNKGFYKGDITGHYGGQTQDAVKAFQEKNHLKADGVAGADTQKLLFAGTGGLSDASINALTTKTVYNIPWETFKSNVSAFKYGRGAKATLYDITTGRSFHVKCQSNGNHSDIEPLTQADTNTMLGIYKVTNPTNITYVRRPVLLITESGEGFAGSIYGTCHGQSTISDNGFPGQFCLHLRESRNHVQNAVDADHQKCVTSAAAWAKGNGYTLVETYAK